MSYGILVTLGMSYGILVTLGMLTEDVIRYISNTGLTNQAWAAELSPHLSFSKSLNVAIISLPRTAHITIVRHLVNYYLPLIASLLHMFKLFPALIIVECIEVFIVSLLKPVKCH